MKRIRNMRIRHMRIRYMVMVLLAIVIMVNIGIPVMAAPIRFVTIGDPHLGDFLTDDEDQRLIQAVNYINGRTDIDFAVVLGDIANNGSAEQFSIGKYILENLNVPYYVVAGNHDVRRNGSLFSDYFGPMENISVVNGYQLLFIGIWNESTPGAPTGNVTLHWSFNFNDSRINKNMPTIVFLHGEVQNTPAGCCINDKGVLKTWDNSTTYYKYAWDMQPELDKFTNLIAVYSGHVHVDSIQTVNGVKYITLASLTNNSNVGWLAPPSNNVGLSTINNGILSYNLVNYFNKPSTVPNIISQSPIPPLDANGTISPIDTNAPSTLTFNISLDKAADVIWQLDGVPVQENMNVIDSSFTNTSFVGKHDVIANPIAYGASPYKWIWHINGNLSITSDILAIPIGIPTTVTFTVNRVCGLEKGDDCSNATILPVSGANITIGANTTYTGDRTTDINGRAIMNLTATKIGLIRATATKNSYSYNYTEIIAGTDTLVNLTIRADRANVDIGVPTDITFTVARPCGSLVGDDCSNVSEIPVPDAKVTMNASNGTYYDANMTDVNGQTILNVNATHNGPIRFAVTKNKFNSNYIIIQAGPVPTPSSGGSSGSSGGGSSGGSSSGGGGGGGGGGLASLEPYDNILKYESQENFITGQNSVPFKYLTPELSVYEVDILGTQSDDATLRIEVLKNTSKLVDIAPDGEIYKNINMWINSKKIQNNTIKFKINNSWIRDNGLIDQDIKLVRWDNNSKKWIELITSISTKDDNYTYFDAQTSGFSSFAIRGSRGDDLSSLSNFGDNNGSKATVINSVPVSTQTKVAGKTMPVQIELIILAITILLMIYIVGIKKK